MKVLVTGGAGYIGSHAVYRLIEKGHEVVVLDNLSQGHQQAIHPQAQFVQADLRDSQALAKLFEAQKRADQPPFDGVMHFASYTLVGESMEKPFLYFRDNLNTVANVLEQCAANGVKRFILSSTANLFDNPQHIPISEDEALIPGSVYGETKYMAERMLMWADRLYGIRYCALRYFNASGAIISGDIGEDHTPETHLIPLVLQVALGQRESVTIFGSDYETRDGTCIRDYVHVIDLADAHILALEALADGPSRVYNLGSGSGYSVKEVIDMARIVTGHPIPAKEGSRRAGDPAKLVADSARIKAELGWDPRHSDLESIMESAWRWHTNHPTGYDDKAQ
jgi:UDP-glucose 4-epimerase